MSIAFISAEPGDTIVLSVSGSHRITPQGMQQLANMLGGVKIIFVDEGIKAVMKTQQTLDFFEEEDGAGLQPLHVD